jgi:hypothetical protein
MSENNQEVDKNALFLQAIQERMSQLVVEYESKVAELRVEYTVLTAERDALLKALEERDAVQASPDEAE